MIPEKGEHPDWGINVSSSTVPPRNWITNKSKIPDKELWLGMSLHRMFECKVKLISKDERFKIFWRNGYLPEVTSDSFLHRKKIAWPTFDSPDDFIDLTKSLEEILKIKFDTNFIVDAYSLDMQGVHFLSQWLSQLAESITFNLGSVYGDIPAELIKRDNRANDGGIKLHVSLR